MECLYQLKSKAVLVGENVNSICMVCESRPAEIGVRCLLCREKQNKRRRELHKEIRDEVLIHYGGKCSCPVCPETNFEFLTIHHLTKEAKVRDKGKTGGNLYPHLKKLGYPTDVCVMCFNCNCGRERHHGICPHELQGFWGV